MKNPRKEKLEKYSAWERKRYLQINIRFSWFIDEHSLLEAVLSLGLHHSAYDYLVDDDFQRYVFKDCTEKDARFIAEKLHTDFMETRSEWDRAVNWPGCTKARLIVSYLDESDGFWKKHPDSMLSLVRRTNCSCHESGSLARRKE